MSSVHSRHPGRSSGLLALLLFLIYLTNILQGKALLVFGWQPLFRFGGVVEFLLLFAAAVCFTVSILRREAHRDIHNDATP